MPGAFHIEDGDSGDGVPTPVPPPDIAEHPNVRPSSQRHGLAIRTTIGDQSAQGEVDANYRSKGIA